MRAPYFGTDAVVCLADIPIVGWTLKISVIERDSRLNRSKQEPLYLLALP